MYNVNKTCKTSYYQLSYTVKLVLKVHLWNKKKKESLTDRLPLKRDLIHVKFSMTRQE